MKPFTFGIASAMFIAGFSFAQTQTSLASDVRSESGNGAQAQSPKTTTPAEALQTQSRVRVIVQLADPAESGATLSGKQIAELQSAVISDVFGTDVASEANSATFGLSRMKSTPVFAINVDAEELARLEADPRVRSIAADMDLDAHLDQSTKLIGMKKSWKAPYKAFGNKTAVVIIDTGVNHKHKFLKSTRIVKQACFSGAGNASDSFCPNGNTKQTGGKSGTNCPMSYNNGCAHGTHVAGIATGYNTNRKSGEPKKGVAYKAKIVAIQVFKKDGGDINTAFSDILLALDWVYKKRKKFGKPVTAINMSIGGGGPYSSNCDGTSLGSAMKQIIDKLRNANIAVTISSGNDGFLNGVSMPACVSSAITVGASTKKASGQPEKIAYYSNIGSVVDVLAPGGDVSPYPTGTNFTPAILSSVPGNGFDGFQGTSMSAPHVAGIWAAIRSSSGCKNKSVKAIEKSLEKKGKKIADVNHTKPRTNVLATLKNLGCG